MAEAAFPLTVEQLQGAGVPYSYAHNIAKRQRSPSVHVAGQILDHTGVAIGPLAGLTATEVKLLRDADALRRARAVAA